MNRITGPLIPFVLVLALASVPGCATTVETDDRTDAQSSPDAGGPDGPIMDAPTTDAPPIDAPMVPPDAACARGWVDLLQNGGFDLGVTNWNETSNGSAVIRQTTVPWPPQSGSYWALFLGYHNGAQTLSQTVSVPPSAAGLRLSGYRCWVTEEAPGTAYDFLNLELRDAAGGLLETLWARDNTHADTVCSWSVFQLDAAESHAGQDVTLIIDATSDGASATSFGFDSLVLEADVCL